MAFTDLEKDCLRECLDSLTRPNRALTEQEQTDLDMILYGNEEERRSVAKAWAQNMCLPQLEASLANLDATKAALEAKKAALEVLIAS